MKKTCEHCKKEFEAQRSDAKYCSYTCRQLAYQKRKILNSENPPTLKVVKGDLFNTMKRVKRTENFLVFCQSLFWSAKNFSMDEQHEYHVLIAEHFRESHDIDQTFKTLVERAILAKRYIAQKPHRFASCPKNWFNVNYTYGLSGTNEWYKRITEQRKTLPHYQLGLTILAEAVMNYFDRRNLMDIYSYREQFIKMGQPDLLQFYMNAVMHIQFINF